MNNEKEMLELVEIAKRVVEEAEANAADNPTSPEILVVIVEPDLPPYKQTITNSLDSFQSIVGGYIEHITIGTNATGAKIGIILNEEGKLQDLPFNRFIIGRGGSDTLVGTFFITAHNLEGDAVTLSDEEAELFIGKFNHPAITL